MTTITVIAQILAGNMGELEGHSEALADFTRETWAADGPRQWEVGVRMGAALRRAYHAAEVQLGGTHSGPRPHVRRAHWHSFWTGKIGSEERRLKPRWLPPIPVNLDDPDSIPAVIRPVKP